MNGRRFSLYNAVVFGFRMALNNVRLLFKLILTSGALVIGTFFVVGAFNFAILSKYLLAMKPQLEALRICTGQVECTTAAQGLIKPVLTMLFSTGWLVGLSMLSLIFVFCLLTVGYKKVALHLHDGKSASVGTFFEGWKLVPKYFVVSLIYLFIVMIGFVLFFIPGIYWLIRFGFFGYFIVDKNAGIIESLKYSFNLTDGYTIELFALGLIVLLITSLGFISLLLLSPVSMFAYVYIYRTLSSK